MHVLFNHNPSHEINELLWLGVGIKNRAAWQVLPSAALGRFLRLGKCQYGFANGELEKLSCTQPAL